MADQPELYDMSDSRYNPFDETWSPRGFGYDMGVDPENRDIPSSSPYFVTLWEQPRKDTPSSMVVYDNDTATTLTEVDKTVSPGANEYRVNYTGERAGLIEFNSAQGGDNIDISYYGLGNNAIVRSLFSVEEKRKENAIADKFSLRLSSSDEFPFIDRRTRTINIGMSLDAWTFLYIQENNTNNGVCNVSVQIYIPSIGLWFGTIEIVTRNNAPVIKVITSTRSFGVANYQYEPQFRALYSSGTSLSGIWVQMLLKSSKGEAGSYVVHLNKNAAYNTSQKGFRIYTAGSASADGTPTYLPDGVTTPVVGSTVWGFSGEIDLGITPTTTTISNTNINATASTAISLFSGWDVNMFKRYYGTAFIFNEAYGADPITYWSPQIAQIISFDSKELTGIGTVESWFSRTTDLSPYRSANFNLIGCLRYSSGLVLYLSKTATITASNSGGSVQLIKLYGVA